MTDVLTRIRALRDRHQAEPPPGLARIGVWECELPFDILTWSGGVYDLFELPRGFRVTRDEILGFYTDESRAMLEEARNRAIRTGTGFALDAEITTALGKSRLMRLTLAVEMNGGTAHRLLGTKRDVTDTKSATGSRLLRGHPDR